MSRSILFILAGFAALAPGCLKSTAQADRPAAEPLADTLVAILEELKDAAMGERTEEFVAFLDPQEVERLGDATRGFGFQSLKSYLQKQFAAWPDPDTLLVEDLLYSPPYARLALVGPGNRLGRGQSCVRYTFLLFKMDLDQWRLAAVSNLEKDEFDDYGTRLSYLETELPPRLRFPRRF
jgi:hypothetical protein